MYVLSRVITWLTAACADRVGQAAAAATIPAPCRTRRRVHCVFSCRISNLLICSQHFIPSEAVRYDSKLVGQELITSDVVIAGGGNAALCAALTAREAGV